MSKAAKILTVSSIGISWGIVALTGVLFTLPIFTLKFFISLVIILLTWLTPFTLMVYLLEDDRVVIGSFTLGVTGFIVLWPDVVVALMIVLAVGGLAYWRKRVKAHVLDTKKPSALNMIYGAGLLFTALSLLGSVLYINSPLGREAALVPQIPRSFFNAIYDPLSSIILQEYQDNVSALSQNPAQDRVRDELYRSANTALKDIATQYQHYIPFIFAAGVFFFLRILFVPIRYITVGLSWLIVELLLYLEVIKKETVTIEKEVLKI